MQGSVVWGTRVRGDHVIESRYMHRRYLPVVATVRICAVIEKPFESGRIQRFAGGKDDGELSVPEGVYIRTVGHEKLHHRDAISVECGSHQRSVPPWCTSDPCSSIHVAMASLVALGDSHGMRHSATHVSGPSLP